MTLKRGLFTRAIVVRSSILTIALLATPRAALACPVCFGNADSPLAIATNTGIIFMLGIVGSVLCGFASFFIYLMRRANRVAAEPDPANAGPFAPPEGTAQW
jgi:hypothetical protein